MKVAIIGLDCADPRMVFEEFLDDMPHVKGLIERGAHGPIRSCDPPITVPAWNVFATSKNPGKLGFFGFRNRKWTVTPAGKTAGYEGEFTATSLNVREPTLWQIASAAGLKVICLGIPQTYPVKPVNGILVADFLAPSIETDYTYPKELKEEIRKVVGEYIIDVRNFRDTDKGRILRDIHEMTEKRFDLAEHFLRTREWDLFFMVEMGTDRIHHALWSFYDPKHPRYEGDRGPFHSAMRDYYKRVDERIGRLLALLPPDCAIVVMSDHGAKASHGAICINDFLIREGYLVLKDKPKGVEKFDVKNVDWSRTRAWGLGGYYGRLSINVKGREPQGIVDPKEYENVRDEIKRRFECMKGPDGRALGTRAVKPQEIYTGPHTDEAPDLFLYFGDLSWRATQAVGNPSEFSYEAEVGPDEAVHDYHGIFIVARPDGALNGRIETMRLLDGAPTILSLLGIPVPRDMEGRVLGADPKFTPKR